jgi:diguanylate cyclase (GGDEF)-like protein
LNKKKTKKRPTYRRQRGRIRHKHAEAGDATVFQELGRALTSSLQLEQVLRTIMDKIDELLHPNTWFLLLMDDAKQELYFELAIGKNARTLKGMRIKMGQGVAGWVAEYQQAAIIPDVSRDTRFITNVDEKTKTETRSVVAVPVCFRNRCLGVIELINSIGAEGFNERDRALLEALASFAAIALENARHVQRIRELTLTDDCTTLYNVRHLNFILETEIYRSERYGYEFCLIFLDLDHFKSINDTHGHLAGTKLLAEIGQVLRSNCRLVDFAFRYGGDEFVFLLPQTSKTTGCRFAQLLHEQIRKTRWLVSENLEVQVTASAGVASYPTDSTTKEGLLHLADETMYMVKNSTRDGVAAAKLGRLGGI